MMDKKRLDVYKKRLLTKQEELRGMVSRTELDGRSADDDPTQDPADKAASSYNKEFLFSVSNGDRTLLAQVQEALDRLNDGTFGECVSCGLEMQPKRLEAVPWARHCIPCQEKQEQGLL
jgi:DnaK suppressor protein